MADIFLSYANEDREYARTLADTLGREGFSVWWDHHIPPGKSWTEVIDREIGNAGCVIVIWSQSSVRSQWVQNEAREGLNRHVLLPVIADQALRPPLEFRHVQSAYLHEWDPDDYRSEYAQLVTSVRDVLGRGMTIPSASELAPPTLPSRRASKWSWIGALVLLLAISAWLWRATIPSPTSAGQTVKDSNVHAAPPAVPEISQRSVEPTAASSTTPVTHLGDNMGDTSGPAMKWHVHLQIPTSMASADVRVDGQTARVVRRVASIITIEIPVGNENHEFLVSSRGKKTCAVTRSIQQNDVVIQPCQV